MALSSLDLYSVGIGPSSSHTVGPMRAARRFAQSLADAGLLAQTTRVKSQIYGSLQRMSIADIMMSNERARRNETEVRARLLHVWTVMQQCVAAGCATRTGSDTGILPGGLNVRRRAPAPFAESSADTGTTGPLRAMDWVNLFALAVNEENAAGGWVVTAPTNGAAGIIPEVLHNYVKFAAGANDAGIVRFLLTAAAIEILIKENASISGAEVGCQEEVGSACAMAAAGLCEVLGGPPAQVENAAEVGLEHNLGLTCDPVGGLVQIPCIEHNAIASVNRRRHDG